MLKKTLLFSALFVFCVSFISAQEKKLKHTVGVFASPVTLSYWIYPYTINDEWSNNSDHLKISFGTPYGISYQYRISNDFGLHCAASYAYEAVQFFAVTREKGNVNIDYHMHYLEVPVGVRFYPSHIIDEDRNGGFFLELNGTFDFVAKEDTKTITSEFYDPRYNYPAYTPATTTITKSDQLRLHRISPAFMVGNEIGKKHFCFMYAAKLQIPAVQRENAQEYFKNIQTSLVLGFNYRF